MRERLRRMRRHHILTKNGCSKSRIVAILNEVDAGRNEAEVCVITASA